MNSHNKRQKSRIQGGWANNGTQQQKLSSSVTYEQKDRDGVASRDANCSGVASTPGDMWRAKTSDATTVIDNQPKFTFQASADLKKEPSTKIIDSAGSYIISMEPSGTSRIQLIEKFIDKSECDWIFEQLYAEVPWKQQIVKKASESYLQPRMTAWFGEHPYAYSGISHDQNLEWTPLLQMLKDRIEETTGFTFNSVLANLYRDGHDHVAWHSDDEVSLGIRPIIASLSFGDTRNFELRKKLSPQENKDIDDSLYMEFIKIPLDAGSLIIMDGCVQQDWQHRVPREYHDRRPRINLTFRTIMSQ